MPDNFEVSIRKMDTEVVVEVIGSIDLMTVGSLADPLAEGVQAAVADPKVRVLSVDFRQVDFIDSSGLVMLVNARKRLTPAGRTLRIFVQKDQQPDRVLRTGRFDTILELRHDSPS